MALCKSNGSRTEDTEGTEDTELSTGLLTADALFNVAMTSSLLDTEGFGWVDVGGRPYRGPATMARK
jgi:hypothetical protein